MNAIRVAVVNWSDITDQEVLSGLVALQGQLDEDFGPAWDVDATLMPSPGTVRRPGHWGLALLDRRSPYGTLQQEALGVYGHLTTDGHPLARVFVDQLLPGQHWTHLASHELLEMLIDPSGNAAVYRDQDGQPFRVYAKRVCDPCAGYSDGYERDGYVVSDFVYPAWFGGWLPGYQKDVRGKIDDAFELLPDGSIAVVDPSTSEWRVLYGDGSLHAPPGEPPVGVLGVGEKVGWGP